jgi:hypothetical protein
MSQVLHWLGHNATATAWVLGVTAVRLTYIQRARHTGGAATRLRPA